MESPRDEGAAEGGAEETPKPQPKRAWYDAWRNIGRTEIAIGLVVMLVIALITVPLARNMSMNSARQELPLYVDAIRQHQLDHFTRFGHYVSAEWAPRLPHQLDADRATWTSNDGFRRLNWSPPQDRIYGTYRTIATGDGFTVTGMADIDGDGVPAVYEATHLQPATAQTPPDVY